MTKLCVLTSFQSMGICFIGERNFENFILEVRSEFLLHNNKVIVSVCKVVFSASSIWNLNQGTLSPLRMGLLWENTKVCLKFTTCFVPALLFYGLCPHRLVHPDVRPEGADRRTERRLVCGGQRRCYQRRVCGEKQTYEALF